MPILNMYIRRKVFSVGIDEYGEERLFSVNEVISEKAYLDQREFNSKEAKERNYKWLRETANNPVEGKEALKAIEDRTAIVRDRLSNEANFKAWKKFFRKDQKEALKRGCEFNDFLRDNKLAKELEEKTKERIGSASNGHRKYVKNLNEAAEKLDRIADTKDKPWETKEYIKSGELRKKAWNSGEEVAMKKAALRGRKAEKDFLEDRIRRAKSLADRENKLSIIRKNNKFSNKLQRGIKSFFKKIVK